MTISYRADQMNFIFFIFCSALVHNCFALPPPITPRVSSNRQLEQWLELMEGLEEETGSIPGKEFNITISVTDCHIIRLNSGDFRIFEPIKLILNRNGSVCRAFKIIENGTKIVTFS